MFYYRVGGLSVTYSERYLWFEAARHDHISWDRFLELDPEVQAVVIAAYQVHRQITGVLERFR